jgi:peroxiredoxin
MIKTRFGWAILAVVVSLLGVAWIAYSRVPSTAPDDLGELTEAPLPGYRAPEFTLSTTIGETTRLSDYEGRPVVLNFWASWCPPCRAEIPHFQESSVKYNGRAVILGIDQGEPLPIVADFGSSLGITYPLLLDTDSSVNRQYAVSALPTTIFIDSHGIVKEVYSGIVNRAVLEDRIEKLLAEG